MTKTYPIIPKEQLPFIIFSKQEVLQGPEKIKARAEKLVNAVRQGRFFYQKTDLLIETQDGLIMVHANIWEATDHNVVLMGGITIPVRSIREVNIISSN